MLWVDAENWCALKPLKEFEENQKRVREEQEKLRSEKLDHGEAQMKIQKPKEDAVEEEDKPQDYSFLDEIVGDSDFNLNDIKRAAKSKKTVRYKEDYEDESSVDGNEDLDFISDEEDSDQEGKPAKQKYNSIEALLDSFDDQGPNESDRLGPRQEEETESPLVQHWNMINHLPAAAVTYFQYTIGKSSSF